MADNTNERGRTADTSPPAQYERPSPADRLDQDAGGEERAGDPTSVDSVLAQALTTKDQLSNETAEPGDAPGSITNMESANQDTWDDAPETDPFSDDER